MRTDFVMIHGGGRGGWCWEPAIQEMQRREHPSLGRIVALDMPGAGRKKDVSLEECTIEGYVTHAIRDILAADLTNVVLVGHSFAGLVMPYIVTRIPERIKRVVFMACAVPHEGESLRHLLVRMGRIPAKGALESAAGAPSPKLYPTEWDIPRSAKRLGETRARWLLENLKREFAKPYPSPATERISRTGFMGLRPVTWILLTRDRSMPTHWQRQFAREAGGEHVEIVEIDAQHDAMISRPREVAEALLRYV